MKELNESVLQQKIKSVSAPGLGNQIAGIAQFLHEAADYELAEIDALVLARKKGLAAIPTLKAMLHLTKSGVFDLNWAVNCPHCKGPSIESQTLAGIKHRAYCPGCAADYDAGFDRNVSMHFKLNPAVAKVENVDPYLVRMHMYDRYPGISMGIEPGDFHSIQVDLKPGNYVLMNAAARKVIVIPVSTSADGDATGSEQAVGNNEGVSRPGASAAGGAAPVSGAKQQFTWEYGPDTQPFRAIGLKAGPFSLRVENKGRDTEEFLFTRVSTPKRTNAALVSTLQEFRDMFAEDLLSPDEAFAIRNIALIFTDIKGSTEMYEKLGDAQAFYLVKEHFKIMEEVVRQHNGAIVKTIGDAVMAVFIVPSDAVAAGAEMIERFDVFNKAQGTKDNIVIKVGAHVGSCIAVTLNDRIDYFGTSVNMAARIQGLSDGRNIMVSERFFEESGAESALAAKGWVWDSFRTSLKGLKDDHKVFKLVKREI